MENFRVWESECNELMLEKWGVGIDDIPDMAWHDWFLAEVTVEEAVQYAINIVNEGGF